MLDWLRRAYPLSQLNVWERSFDFGPGVADAHRNLIKPSCGDINSTLLLGKVLDLIFGAYGLSDVPVGAHYYGLVSDNGGSQFMRGCAMGIPHYVAAGPTGAASWGWDFDGSYGDWYGAHELGHTYGRYHAEFCNALGGSTYPYPDGRISPVLTGNNALYGFDIGNQTIYGPQWKDLMTYCSYEWVSDFTYEGLHGFLPKQPGAGQRAALRTGGRPLAGRRHHRSQHQRRRAPAHPASAQPDRGDAACARALRDRAAQRDRPGVGALSLYAGDDGRRGGRDTRRR